MSPRPITSQNQPPLRTAVSLLVAAVILGSAGCTATGPLPGDPPGTSAVSHVPHECSAVDRSGDAVRQAFAELEEFSTRYADGPAVDHDAVLGVLSLNISSHGLECIVSPYEVMQAQGNTAEETPIIRIVGVYSSAEEQQRLRAAAQAFVDVLTANGQYAEIVSFAG